MGFASLTGDVLDMISEYLPQRSAYHVPPTFVLCNSELLRSYSEYKRENYGIQVEILID